MPPTQTDPWLDADKDGFGQVSFTPDPEDLFPDEPNIVIAPNDQLEPEIVTNTVVPEPDPLPEPVAVVAPDPEGPELIENTDGTFIQIEKSSKGWKATLDSSAIGGRKEVFYGKTKTEMFNNIAVGKMNATKELNKLNRRIKLGEGDDTPPIVVQQMEKITGRRLTADESTEIKLLLETDPDKGLDTWFQKRTGTTVDQLVQQAQEGKQASNELYMEGVHKQFLGAVGSDYYPDPGYVNYSSLLAYLAKNKLRRKLTTTNQTEIINLLLENGQYTSSNLEEAFAELSEDGLLLKAPTAPRVTPATPVVPVEPAPQDRIVRQETRPRAGLGIRPSEVTPVRGPAPTPPSAEDINDLSDEELANLYKATVRAAQSERYPRRK